MTPAEMAVMAPEDCAAMADRLVDDAMEDAGFSPADIIAACRSRHQDLARVRGVALDDIEQGARIVEEVFRTEVPVRVAAFMRCYERRVLSEVDGFNRQHRRRALSEIRTGMRKASAGIQKLFSERIRASLRETLAKFDDAEDDFSRMMREAMEG